MSGLGRRTHYRKHLTDSVLYDFPEPASNECIAKVISTRGSNQFDVQLAKEISRVNGANGDIDQNNEVSLVPNPLVMLAILPTKFRKLIWLKRNDFVIVQYAKDTDDDNNDHNGNSKRNESLSNEANACSDTVDDSISTAIQSGSTAVMSGGGIRYMITHILYKNQIQHLISTGLWPLHDPDFDTTKISSSDDNNTSNNNNETTENGIVYNTTNYNHTNDYDQHDGNDDDDDDDDDIDNDEDDDDGSYVDDNDDDLFVNTNRMSKIVLDDSSSENE
jgi:probable RNA-binding protein EIF1AD